MKKAYIALGIIGGAYIYDVVYRPIGIAKKAQKYAQSVNKGVINVGAGVPQSSMRVAIFGPTKYGDINCDIAASKTTPCSKDTVCYCNIHETFYADGEFGAAIVSHVFGFMDDPQKVLDELLRIADRVYIVTDKWWDILSWKTLVGDNKWVKVANKNFLKNINDPRVLVF